MPAYRVTEQTSPSGTRQPTLHVQWLGDEALGSRYRWRMAHLYRLAALVQDATPANRDWVVVIGVDDVHLELVNGMAMECGDGMATLADVADAALDNHGVR